MCKYKLLCKNYECQIENPKEEKNGFPKCFVRWFEYISS
jgi:hypothetical protein